MRGALIPIFAVRDIAEFDPSPHVFVEGSSIPEAIRDTSWGKERIIETFLRARSLFLFIAQVAALVVTPTPARPVGICFGKYEVA